MPWYSRLDAPGFLHHVIGKWGTGQSESFYKIAPESSLNISKELLRKEAKMDRKEEHDETLDAAFEVLRTTEDKDEIRRFITKIWEIWLDSGQPEINELMDEGNRAMATGNTGAAIEAYGKVIEKRPDYAEGWNKRATAFYNAGDFKASIRDIEQTLALEKRHFGALSGLATIYYANGDKQSALKSFEALLDIYPYYPNLWQRVTELHDQLGIKQSWTAGLLIN